MTQEATSLHTYRALETGWKNEHKEPGAFTWEGKEEYGEQDKMSQPQERCIPGYMCGIKSIVHSDNILVPWESFGFELSDLSLSLWKFPCFE